jgi:hypothetical protein
MSVPSTGCRYLGASNTEAIDDTNSRKRRLDQHSEDCADGVEVKSSRTNAETQDAVPGPNGSHALTAQELPEATTASTTICPAPTPAARKRNAAEEAVRNAVFRDIHERGFFLGPADVYGGDYSLYKGGGDPTRTHSVATVRVVSRGHKVCCWEC